MLELSRALRELDRHSHVRYPFFRTPPGQTQALGSALSALSIPSAPGPTASTVASHLSFDDTDVWFVCENWRSLGGLDAWTPARGLCTCRPF